MWTTDWDVMQLRRFQACIVQGSLRLTFSFSLMPKPLGTLANSHNLKRKSCVTPSHSFTQRSTLDRVEAAVTNKKAKKSLQKNHTFSAHPNTTYTAPFDPNDQAALNRRAARFQREHELEKTKHLKNNIPPQVRNKFQQMYISRGATPNGNSDDPEANPVRYFIMIVYLLINIEFRTSWTGIDIRLSGHQQPSLRTT